MPVDMAIFYEDTFVGTVQDLRVDMGYIEGTWTPVPDARPFQLLLQKQQLRQNMLSGAGVPIEWQQGDDERRPGLVIGAVGQRLVFRMRSAH